MEQTKILIIYTGGTIGMAPRDPGNPSSPFEPKPLEELLSYMPALARSGIKLVFESFDPPLDSCDIQPRHWVAMARLIRQYYDSCDGFVILHGTDTMAYTTSALAFILVNLAKPVVVTGAQLPISFVRTDAVQNLASAIHLAGYKATGLPCIPEVVLCFADKILRGCRATKISTDGWAIFDSPNFPPLGTIGSQISINTNLIRSQPAEGAAFSIHEEFDRPEMRDVEVLDLGLFPGFRPRQLVQMLSSPHLRGVVLRTFGSGNAPTDVEFLKALDQAIHQRTGEPLVVVNVTQCTRGLVEMGRYVASSNLLECGVISGMDLSGEAALAKLYWAIATQPPDRIARQMQLNQCGEQSENLLDLRFLPVGTKSSRVLQATSMLEMDLNAADVRRVILRLLGLEVRVPQNAADAPNLELIEEAPPWNGLQARVRLFVDFPAADQSTPITDSHFAGEIVIDVAAHPATVIYELPKRSWKLICGEYNLLGEGDPKGQKLFPRTVQLTLVMLDEVEISFKRLSLAVFTRERY